MPEKPQSVDSSLGGSHQWSCGTLEEGLQQVQAAVNSKAASLEEAQLLKELQERSYIIKSHDNICLFNLETSLQKFDHNAF